MLTASRTGRHRPAHRHRCGFTLAELVVALGLSGVTFGSFAIIVARQERTYTELARRVRARNQSSEGMAALMTELRGIAPRAGDIPPGGARDSAIEFRANVGSFIVCERRGQTIVAGLASFATTPKPGDTAWVYVDADDAPRWAPLPVVGVALLPIAHPVECGLPAQASAILTNRPSPSHRYSLALAQGPPPDSSGRAPVRVTRQVRYSLYRAPDSQWYLGRREWSGVQGRFETIQPVSGPYADHAALRYSEATGLDLPSGTAAADRIAAIRLSFRAPGGRQDSTSIVIGVRNR